VNIKPFFRDFIYGTNPLEWEKELAYAGLEVTCSDTIPKAWLGLGTMEADGLLKVTQVVANSPAYLSGLSNGDEILAINGDKAFSSSFSSRIREMKPGDPITLTCFQNDRLRTITVTLGTAPKSNYSVAQVKTPTDLQKAIYESWLGAKWAKEEKK
jgi:predicted metalloprotease with PDZ domain